MNNLTVTIGDDLVVNRIGLGTNRNQNNATSKQILKKAVELGINFIDTAEAYTNQISETTIGETLAPYDGIVVATKGGMRAPDFHIDSSRESLQFSLEGSLQRLKLNTIPLYFLHRVDPKIPLEESVKFLKEMQDTGKIKHVGLSHVTIAQIEAARKIVDIVAVENEYNLTSRESEAVIDYCEKEGIIFVTYFPLHADISENDQLIKELMTKYNVTLSQLQLAWLLARSPIMLPIPGTLSQKHLEENLAAAKIKLAHEDFESLSKIGT